MLLDEFVNMKGSQAEEQHNSAQNSPGSTVLDPFFFLCLLIVGAFVLDFMDDASLDLFGFRKRV